MDFVAAFTEPVLSDTVSGSFGGLLLPRLSWNSGAGLSRGQVGFTTTEHFTTYSASSGLTYGVWRSVGLFGQYSYYRYQIPQGSTTLNLLSHFGHQTISVGLSLWVPIINNGRARS
jgi:hypothetical protein